MLYNNIQIGEINYPDQFIDPSEKGLEYHRQFIQACLCNSEQNADFVRTRNQWRINELYAQGRQPVEPYIRTLCGLGENDRIDSYMSINYKPLPILPKIRDSVIGHLSKIDWQITADAINPAAIDEKDERTRMLWAEKELQPLKKAIEQEAGISLGRSPDMDWVPDSREEFEMLAKFKVKLAEEIEAEAITKDVFEKNEWKVTERKLLEDAFDNAFMMVERTVDAAGNIRLNHINPTKSELPQFSERTGESTWIAGYVDSITLHQLIQEAGDSLTIDDYKYIAQFYNSVNGTQWNLGTWDATFANRFSEWKSIRIYRMKCYWYDVDVKKYTITEKTGQEPVYRYVKYKTDKQTEYNKEGMTIKVSTKESRVENIRQCSWIIGTDKAYNWGKYREISRDQMNKRESLFPIKFYQNSDQSRVERCIPVVDSLCLSWFRLQDRKARAIPSGVDINLDGLEKIVTDQKQWSVKELTELKIQTGIGFHRNSDTMLPDNGSPAPNPFSYSEGGIGRELPEIINSMQADFELMRQLTGINEMLDTTLPNEKQPVTTSKLAFDSSVNSLSDMVDGLRYINEKCAIDIMGVIQNRSKNGELYANYSPSLGKMLQIGSELGVVQLGIKVSARNMEKETELLRLRVEQAMQSNTPMDFDDTIYIDNIIQSPAIPFKLKEQLISYRITKRREQINADAQKNAVEQQKMAQQLEAMKRQGEREAIKFETDENIRFEQALTAEIIKRNNSASADRMVQAAQKSELKKNEQTHKTIVE